MSDIAQMDMFSQPIIPVSQKGSIEERFVEFHRQNTHVYCAFVLVTKEWIEATGATRVGAKFIFEQLRWRFGIRTKSQTEFALDNSLVSRYARLAASLEPELKDVFEFRRLRSVA